GRVRWMAIEATIRPSVIAARKAITSEKRLRNSRSEFRTRHPWQAAKGPQLAAKYKASPDAVAPPPGSPRPVSCPAKGLRHNAADMAPHAPPDFRLYHSNALEVLAGILADILRTPADPGRPLAPDVVLIPQVAMRRWLQATLAQRHGVAANIEFLTPGEFVGRALEANLGPTADELDPGVLRWHLYAALTDPALLARPALAAIAGYVDDGAPLPAWSLAGELATVFGKYQAWRRDGLPRWE